jgi:hypothetical protein
MAHPIGRRDARVLTSPSVATAWWLQTERRPPSGQCDVDQTVPKQNHAPIGSLQTEGYSHNEADACE